MAALWQAVGTKAEGTSGAITPAWPTHAINDLGIMVVETTPADSAPGTVTNWTQLTGSPLSQAGGSTQTRLSVYWKIATSASEAAPSVSNGGEHIVAVVFTIRGVKVSDPFDVTAITQTKTVSTACSINGVNATEGGNDVVYVACRGSDVTINQYASAANANLTGSLEKYDDGTTLGNGGGFGIFSGNLAAAGATGTLTATVASSTIEVYAVLTFKKSLASSRVQIIN